MGLLSRVNAAREVVCSLTGGVRGWGVVGEQPVGAEAEAAAADRTDACHPAAAVAAFTHRSRVGSGAGAATCGDAHSGPDPGKPTTASRRRPSR
jgi:hypothetical protein